MLLNWKDGKCTNPPKEWNLCSFVPTWLPDKWQWEATRMDRSGEVLSKHYATCYPTERQAQLACESALIRLGVLGLPAWESHPGAMTLAVAEAYASARVSGSGDRWAFDSVDVHESVWYATADDAKAAAERHLRAELAAFLDAEAAKEGAA